MSNNLQIFQSPEFGSHRFIEIDGEIWIAGIDVCNVLEYKIPQKAITDHVDEEDRLRLSYQELQTIQNGSFEIPTRGLTFINISGFLSLVLSSKLPGAKRYRRWVTSEVLPAIHKNGFYSVEKRDSYMIEDKIERAKRWIEEEEERQRLIEENNELKPKASYCDEVLKCDNLVTTTEIAKAYGKSAVWLNEFLREHDVQYYLKGQKVWILKAQYANQGYAHLESVVVPSRDRCQQHLANVSIRVSKNSRNLPDLRKGMICSNRHCHLFRRTISRGG